MKPVSVPIVSSPAMRRASRVTTHVHLVRHGHHALLGRVLCGRMPGVQLDELGCSQMAAVAQMIKQTSPSALQSSPQRRALQSAGIVASTCGLAVEIVPAFDEIDMGEWTGAEFSGLASDERWQRCNGKRRNTRTPGGVSEVTCQARGVRHIRTFRALSRSISLL